MLNSPANAFVAVLNIGRLVTWDDSRFDDNSSAEKIQLQVPPNSLVPTPSFTDLKRQLIASLSVEVPIASTPCYQAISEFDKFHRAFSKFYIFPDANSKSVSFLSASSLTYIQLMPKYQLRTYPMHHQDRPPPSLPLIPPSYCLPAGLLLHHKSNVTRFKIMSSTTFQLLQP